MKPTPMDTDKFRSIVLEELLKAFEKKFGPIDAILTEYNETELRVISKSAKFEGVHEAIDCAKLAMELLYDKWNDIVDLEGYMTSGDWQKDYEAEERGELRKDIPKGVLSQDALYNDLMDFDDVLTDMRRLVRHCKTLKKKEMKE